jgi:hypothetical protein
MKKRLFKLTLLRTFFSIHALSGNTTNKVYFSAGARFLCLLLMLNQSLSAQVITDRRLNQSENLVRKGDSSYKRPINNAMQKATACSVTTTGTIPLLSCNVIGTSDFNSSLFYVDFPETTDYQLASLNSPSIYGSSNPSCWPGGIPAGEGTWNSYSLDAGVESISVQFDYLLSDGFIGGSTIWMTFYQGTSCGNLVELGCEEFLGTNAFGIYLNEIFVNGLDHTQPLWIYTSSDSWFDLWDIKITGFSEVDNESCAGSGSTDVGCNVGAPGDTDWSGPSAYGEMCYGTNCTYTVTLYDLYNDGWNGGGELRIFLDGVLTHTFTIASGQSGTSFEFSPLPNQLIQIVFHTGTYNGDNAVVLTYPFESSVLLFGYGAFSGTSSGLNYTIFNEFVWCTQAWYSNENTVYYSFTATEESGSVSIENALCNDGTAGEIQIGVWKTCGAVGSYGNPDFVGCAVGNGSLQLPDLEVGENYVLVADGQAGDVCTWDFVTEGITLPVQLILLEAREREYYNEVYWKTASERNSDYFVVERSFDGISFSAIDTLMAAGHSTQKQVYLYNDYKREFGPNYYRLKQVDTDGQSEYFGPRLVMVEAMELMVVPNPVKDVSSFYLIHPFAANTVYSIVISDLLGREVMRMNYDSTFSTEQIELPAESMASGMYAITVIQGDDRKSVKFVRD